MAYNISEDTAGTRFRVFERQSEVDYFINKDAKAFLEEQFNLWLYQYVFSGESEWTETRIRQLQALKDIAFKIIAFISQFENELVKIWNKPKFVLNSNYVITLDRIAEKNGGIALVEKLLAHKNFKAQVEEWQQLGIVDKSFKKADVLEKNGKGKRLAKPYTVPANRHQALQGRGIGNPWPVRQPRRLWTAGPAHRGLERPTRPTT